MTPQERKVMEQALEALELAQDNLRPHGDNCFLHDDGEYNRCFCGKDSLSDHLQSVIENLDTALRQAIEHASEPELKMSIDYMQVNCCYDMYETAPLETQPPNPYKHTDLDAKKS